MNKNKIEEAFKEIISALDIKDESIINETPSRIATSYEEIFSGIDIDPKEVIKNKFPVDNNDIVIQKNIDFYSMCEHHFLPFFGKIDVAYIPKNEVLGLGDIVKITEILSRRPQIQERLTNQIAKNIYEIIDAEVVYVRVEAKHLCMTMRGAKKENTSIITAADFGFSSDSKKIEILSLLK